MIFKDNCCGEDNENYLSYSSITWAIEGNTSLERIVKVQIVQFLSILFKILAKY